MRIIAKNIKKITASIKVETNDTDVKPVIAGLTMEFHDEVTVNKDLIKRTVENMMQILKDTVNKEVE